MSERSPSVVLTTARPAGPHLVLAGELDGGGAARLRAQLDDAVAPGLTLSLDLSRVTRLSSEALSVLVQAHRRLRDGGGALELSAVSPQVVRVLRVSGLHRALVVTALPEPAAKAVERASGA